VRQAARDSSIWLILISAGGSLAAVAGSRQE
jgi:hypothetical protein